MNIRLKAILPLFLSIVISSSLSAQNKRSDERKLVVKGYGDECVLFVPKNYDAAKKHPVILHFHGAGGHPNTMINQIATGKRDYLIVGLAFPEWLINPGKPRKASEVRKAMLDYFKAVIDELKKNYNVDESKIILSGLSAGGWATYEFGVFPEKSRDFFRGCVIIAAGPVSQQMVKVRGKLQPRERIKASRNLRNFPVLVLNGEKDQNLFAAKMGCPILKKMGAKVTQVVIPGQGHIPNPRLMCPQIKKWLDKVAR